MTALLSTTVVEAGPVAEGGALLAWRRFRRNRLALAGLAVVLLFVLFCFAGPLVYHTDQTSTDLAGSTCPPARATRRHRRRRA